MVKRKIKKSVRTIFAPKRNLLLRNDINPRIVKIRNDKQFAKATGDKFFWEVRGKRNNILVATQTKKMAQRELNKLTRINRSRINLGKAQQNLEIARFRRKEAQKGNVLKSLIGKPKNLKKVGKK